MSDLDAFRTYAEQFGLHSALDEPVDEVVFYGWQHPMNWLLNMCVDAETQELDILVGDVRHFPPGVRSLFTPDEDPPSMLEADLATVTAVWVRLGDIAMAHGLQMAQTAAMVEVYRAMSLIHERYVGRLWSLGECCALVTAGFAWEHTETCIERDIPPAYMRQVLDEHMAWALMADLFPLALEKRVAR